MNAKASQNNEPKVSIACVNFTTRWGEKDRNLDKMKRFARTAAKRGGDIIVFPELALSGYECDEEGAGQHKPCNMHREAAETVPGPSTEEMAKLANELGVYIIFGMPEQDKADPDVTYNAAAIVAPDGILGTYHKITLAPPPRYNETACFRPGNSIPVWDTKFGPVGIQICLDVYMYPELSRIMAFKGANIIFNVSAAPAGPGQDDFIMQQASSRATENLVYTATANLTGKDRITTYQGYSNIAGPGNQRLSQVIAHAEEAEEIVSATVDLRLTQYWSRSLMLKETHPTALINKEMKSLE